MKTAKTDKRIVVLLAGWVHIGDYHPATATAPAYLTDAHNVRAWGTTAGLGELANKGPTKSTVLDYMGVCVLDNPAAVLFTLKCEV